MPTEGAWHEGHILAGYLNPACASCRREERRSVSPRNKNRTHATAPFYERVRRNGEAVEARQAKQQRRRARDGTTVDVQHVRDADRDGGSNDAGPALGSGPLPDVQEDDGVQEAGDGNPGGDQP